MENSHVERIAESIQRAGVEFQLVVNAQCTEIHIAPTCRTAELISAVIAFVQDGGMQARKRRGGVIQIERRKSGRRTSGTDAADD